MFDDTKGVIRICKQKKNRQCNGQKENHKESTNTQSPLKTGREPFFLHFLLPMCRSLSNDSHLTKKKFLGKPWILM